MIIQFSNYHEYIATEKSSFKSFDKDPGLKSYAIFSLVSFSPLLCR
jgi:hypothetical protein